MRLPARITRFKLQKSAEDVDLVLRQVVRDAAHRVPFYRDLYGKAAIDVSRFGAPKDLSALPLSSREAFQESPERGLLRDGRDPHHLARTSTSGSTGKPLTIYLSRSELYFRRYSILAGLRHYVPLRFPLHVADVGSMVPHGGKSVEQSLGIVRILRIPGNAPLPEQRAALLHYRPAVLEGYPTCLGILAESFSETEARLVRPSLVATRGEWLRDDAREVLRRTFRAPVVSLYNCEEVGNLAWECPDHNGRFHLNHDTCVLEVVDAHGDPTTGEGDVVVTSLYNRTMPFLRYDLDDRAQLVGDADTTCPCGAAGPWLTDLSGSEDDFVSFPDGHRIAPLVLPNALFNAFRVPDDPHRLSPSVRRYQIVQDADYSLRVILDWRGPYDEVLWKQITSEMDRACQGLRCTVERSAAFELTPAGKFKEVLSQVRSAAAPTGSAPTSAA
ncbi:MAG: hypothetical protein NTY63_08800 [Candidatus Bipolaricaulota bacterium]|nr:hypothetical protein [Candidatus Bipolaricaulota bacterium]